MLTDHIQIHGDRLVKHILDSAVIAGLPLSFFEWEGWNKIYPPLAVIWIIIRLYETQTIRRFIKRVREWVSAFTT